MTCWKCGGPYDPFCHNNPPTCTEPGCNKPPRWRTKCTTHYRKHLRNGTLHELPPSTKRKPGAQTVENVEWLLGGGPQTLEGVAERLNMTTDAVRQALYRRNRYDLARQLTRRPPRR